MSNTKRQPPPCFLCYKPAEAGHVDEIFVGTPILHVRCSDPACFNHGLRYGIEHWERLCMESEVDRFAHAVASGARLDKCAEMVGIERGHGESDSALRERIESCKL